VYVVLLASGALGVNVAVRLLLLKVTFPVTAEPPCAASVKVDVVIVDAFIGALNVAVTAELTATPVARFAGVTGATDSTVATQLLVQVVPPPPPPHPAIARLAVTSHQAVVTRITNFSLGSFR
jgi:hypothetical protein